MGLEFPGDWRFDESLGQMPQAAISDLVTMVEKVAAQAESPRAVYELFKTRFGISSTSSSESWALTDMAEAMRAPERNIPEFLEAYWMGMLDAGSVVSAPSAERINAILRRHQVGYVLAPPRIVQEVSGTPVAFGEDAASDSSGKTTAAPLPGYLVGPRLGEGAYGEVYRATRKSPFCEFEVAIKFHRPTNFTDPERARSRFEREARALARLQHRGIVAYTDAGIDKNGRPFLVMPLISGHQLRDAAANQTPRQTVMQIVDVLGAVSYAHDNNVLHRDLKPSNILVRSADSQAIIVDFGLAYIIDNLDAKDLTMSTVGTAAYVPHECIANPTLRTVGHDIYSCGVVLYEILARRLPDPIHYTELATLNEKWGPLDPVVRMALARADQRFLSASEFRTALLDAAMKLGD